MTSDDEAAKPSSEDGEPAKPSGQDDEVTVVLTRSHARELDLEVGSRVWLAPNRGATTMPVVRAV